MQSMTVIQQHDIRIVHFNVMILYIVSAGSSCKSHLNTLQNVNYIHRHRNSLTDSVISSNAIGEWGGLGVSTPTF